MSASVVSPVFVGCLFAGIGAGALVALGLAVLSYALFLLRQAPARVAARRWTASAPTEPATEVLAAQP